MRYTILQLKAPWPEGAQPGDVIDFPEGVPAWALGKCAPATANSRVTVSFKKGEAGTVDDTDTSLSDEDAKRVQATLRTDLLERTGAEPDKADVNMAAGKDTPAGKPPAAKK